MIMQMGDKVGHHMAIMVGSQDQQWIIIAVSQSTIQKTKGTAIADTLQWAESNRFQAPKITSTEQITLAASELAKALKKSSTTLLPDEPLKQNVEQLCAIFEKAVDNIIVTKLKPLRAETNLSKDTNAPPRVSKKVKKCKQNPRVTDLLEPEITNDDVPINLDIQANEYDLQQQYHIPNHRYSTRSKIATAANTIQLEQHQLSNPTPVTHKFLPEAIQPPPALKYSALMKISDAPVWKQGMCNELGRLAQGYKDITGINTIYFIYKHQVPKGEKVTHGRIVCAIRPHKKEVHRVRLTAGGNLIDCDGVTTTPTAGITTIKTHWNSVISTEKAKYGTIDISNFFLMAWLKDCKYMKLPISVIPDEIMTLYKLHDKVVDGFVYIQIRGGMHGLPMAGKLAHDDLVEFLGNYGYHPAKYTPGLWTHDTRDISFTLVVDDFGVKYVKYEDYQHLANTLAKKHKITTDLTGNLCIGVTLDWDYDKRTVKCLMPGYIPALLNKFQQSRTFKQQYSPHPAPNMIHGAKTQWVHEEKSLPILDKEGIKLAQQIIGGALYLGRIIDSTILVTCNEITLNQNKSTMKTLNFCTWLLDYMATYPNPSITYHRSDMQLHISSDSSHLSVINGRSRVGGYHFLSNKPKENTPLAQ